jgi:uncharacterized protein YndB with AHSA1/START domain
MPPEESEELELKASRWLPFSTSRVWTACSTKAGLERWWSPEDLRTTVRKLEVRPGGAVAFHIRYLPALLTTGSTEPFRAARIPIAFDMRGRVSAVVEERLLAFDLTLEIGKGGAGVDSSTRLELAPEGAGTRVTLVGTGKRTPHWITLGQQNLEAQLVRLEEALESPSPSADPRDDD